MSRDALLPSLDWNGSTTTFWAHHRFYLRRWPSVQVPWCYTISWRNPLKPTSFINLNPLSILDYALWCSVWIAPCIGPWVAMSFCQWVNCICTPTLVLKSLAVKWWFSPGIFNRPSIDRGKGSRRRREAWRRTPAFCSAPELGTQELGTGQLAACVFCRFSVWNPSSW